MRLNAIKAALIVALFGATALFTHSDAMAQARPSSKTQILSVDFLGLAYNKPLNVQYEFKAGPLNSWVARAHWWSVDNSALLGQYVGVGAGIGLINKTIGFRLSAEIGYKIAFGGGLGHYFVEPRVLMDAYLITNHVGRRILPYIALPFGYTWW